MNINTATLIPQPQVELNTLLPFSKGHLSTSSCKGWNDGYYHIEWLPVHPLSLEYMKGYRLG